MSHEKKHAQQKLGGRFRHLIFSPKGTIEGLLIEVDGAPTQLVIDPEHGDSPLLGELKDGQQLELSAAPHKPSPKGEPVHALLQLERLLTINGRTVSAADAAPTTFSGIVARFNFAKHGEPNGVVLDSGDFIHLRPEGMAAAGLKIGDRVSAQGESRRLSVGQGHVIEARELNGHKLKHGPAHAKL